MAVVSEGAQILHVNLCDSRFARTAHDSVFERPREKLREYGDKIKTHCPQFIVETFAADIVNRGGRELLAPILSLRTVFHPSLPPLPSPPAQPHPHHPP